MKNKIEVEFDEELYKEIGQILQVKPLYVKPGLTEEQKKQGYLVHVASTLTEMFQEKLADEKQKSFDEGKAEERKQIAEEISYWECENCESCNDNLKLVNKLKEV